VDLYFFEDKPEVAKNHVRQLFNSIKYFILKIIGYVTFITNKLSIIYNNKFKP
jgi:hypothetical protein